MIFTTVVAMATATINQTHQVMLFGGWIGVGVGTGAISGLGAGVCGAGGVGGGGVEGGGDVNSGAMYSKEAMG